MSPDPSKIEIESIASPGRTVRSSARPRSHCACDDPEHHRSPSCPSCPFSGLQPIGCCQVGSISKQRATSGVTG